MTFVFLVNHEFVRITMKSTIKDQGHAVVLLIATSILLILQSCRLHYDTSEVSFTVSSTPELIASGKRLTNLLCSPCHYDHKTNRLSGIRMMDVPGFVGKVYSKNLTRHPENEITSYTDGELAFLIRTGVSRDGKLMPYMQRPNLADRDLQAIIAFLRSDDELVQAAESDLPETSYSILGRIGVSSFKPLPYPDKEILKPDPADKIAYGYYLVDNLGCYDCHSASFMRIDKLEPEKSKGYMGGGIKLKDHSGKSVASPNLTFHNTGIGGWSEEHFHMALTQGIGKDNNIVTFPMPFFVDLTDYDISAIYAYLKTVSKVDNRIKK